MWTCAHGFAQPCVCYRTVAPHSLIPGRTLAFISRGQPPFLLLSPVLSCFFDSLALLFSQVQLNFTWTPLPLVYSVNYHVGVMWLFRPFCYSCNSSFSWKDLQGYLGQYSLIVPWSFGYMWFAHIPSVCGDSFFVTIKWQASDDEGVLCDPWCWHHKWFPLAF